MTMGVKSPWDDDGQDGGRGCRGIVVHRQACDLNEMRNRHSLAWPRQRPIRSSAACKARGEDGICLRCVQ